MGSVQRDLYLISVAQFTCCLYIWRKLCCSLVDFLSIDVAFSKHIQMVVSCLMFWFRADHSPERLDTGHCTADDPEAGLTAKTEPGMARRERSQAAQSSAHRGETVETAQWWR